MPILFVWINAGDLLNVDDVRTMTTYKLVFVQDLFKMIHRFILQEIAFLCMDLYIVVSGFQVKNVMSRDDLDLASILYHHALALRRGKRSCFQQFLCRLFSIDILVLHPFAHCFVKAILVEWLQQVIDGTRFESFYCIFIKCSGEND